MFCMNNFDGDKDKASLLFAFAEIRKSLLTSAVLDALAARDKEKIENARKDDEVNRRKSFYEVYEKQLELRREQLKTAAAEKKQEDKQAANLSMQKLYTSLMLRLGGHAPLISSDDPNASAHLLTALESWRSGSRQPFAQDSDLFSMPQFPVVRFTE